jgi:hypothetical protein
MRRCRSNRKGALFPVSFPPESLKNKIARFAAGIISVSWLRKWHRWRVADSSARAPMLIDEETL